jgi:hypothetical protein
VSDLFPPSLDEQIACVRREIGYRQRVYPRRVAARQMTQGLADKQIALMSAVLETLLRVQDSGR